MKILVLNGPNLNMLGARNKKHYGSITLDEINVLLKNSTKKEKIALAFFQSNHEGMLIDYLQEYASSANGILINPGALTHYGYALRDALEDANLPVVEVHMSNLDTREEFRKVDVLDGIVLQKITGKKEQSYIEGLENLIAHIKGVA